MYLYQHAPPAKMCKPIKRSLIMKEIEFQEMYQMYIDALFSYSLQLTHSEDEAYDLLQEASYKAYKYRNSFSQGTNFRAWMFTIIKNTFINNYRVLKKQRIINAAVENMEYASKEVVRNEAPQKIRMDEILGIIDGLNDKYGDSFKMFYEGYSYEEIAERTQAPLGTVKSRIFTARKKISQEMTRRKLVS